MSTPSKSLRTVELVSRVLVSAIFVAAGIDKARHRQSTQRYMKSKNMPLVQPLLGGALAVELVVAPALALGLMPRWTAPLLSAFLVPTSLIFHDFWNYEGQERKMQSANFFKNMAIVGGLAVIAVRDYERVTSRSKDSSQPGLEQAEGPRPGYLDEAQFDVA